jgi:hypothetical protein
MLMPSEETTRGPSRGRGGLIAVRWLVPLLIFALFTAACSRDETAASLIGISPEAFTQIIEGDEDFLSPVAERKVEAWIGYVDGDQVIRIGNGGSVPFGDLEIEFQVTPFPPTQFDVGVDLMITGPGGVPADVQIEAWYDMIFMTHGQPTAEIESLGGGHYRMPLDLFMFGPWVVKASVQSATVPKEMPPLVIYVWPKT